MSQPLVIVRRARWFLVGLHLPFLVGNPLYVASGLSGPPGNTALAIVLSIAAVGLQLRHSLAVADGNRPAGWPWTLAALGLVAAVPIWWWGWNWVAMTALFVASAAMLLRGWPMVILACAPIVLVCASAFFTVLLVDRGTAAQLAWYPFAWLTSFLAASGSLFGAARLVHFLDELYAARTELAEAAIGRERARVSRDLHDLLGQSLSAVSLKGDLAIRLLPRDPARARAEIEGLTGLARTALHDIRAVTRDEHAVSLRQEIDAAAGLLEAAGITAEIDTTVDTTLPSQVQDVLAWAVREGTTNLLRHSQAHSCTITLVRRQHQIRLDIVNDGVRVPPATTGSGLSGLADRTRSVAGTMTVETSDGRFRLAVEIPHREAA